MATEIILNRWCDGVKLSGSTDWVLRHEIQTAPATVRTHALDGKPARNVDLCDPCDEEMTLAELRVCLREFGVALEAGKNGKKSAASTAPVDHDPLRIKVINAARTGKRHGREPDHPRTDQCIWCPLNYTRTGFAGHVKKDHGFKNLKEAVGTRCPVCGVDGFEILSGHAVRAHEAKSVTDLFLWARDNGDPFGVYAERRAAGQNIVEALV